MFYTFHTITYSLLFALILLPNIVFAEEIQQSSKNILELTIDDIVKEYLTSEDISSLISNKPFLYYEPTYKIELQKSILCHDNTEPCPLTALFRDSFHINNGVKTTPNIQKIKSFVGDLATRTTIDPSNAKLKFNTETKELEEISKHVDGIKLNTDLATQLLIDAMENIDITKSTSIELPIIKNPAEITSDNAKSLGIKELLGEGISDFKGSTLSRIHNIKTAANRFNGLIIAPNEEFSFVSVLGPVDKEHGYKEELVIRDNETKPEYGGGICQVSTTVFRGAIFTGMKITQRRNHSYPVHYYMPIGFDATVYVPAPDFRFINNTPGHILLTMEIKDTTLIFKYYGTADGRKTKMEGPVVTERQPNGAMKTYFTQKVTDKYGKVIIDDIFKSNYKSPDDYPHPGDVAKFAEKPTDWSKNQWKKYKQENGL